MKVTAKAPANIAFIKYWGKKNEELRIPENNSISMNLSNLYAVTSVEFDNSLKSDEVSIDNQLAIGKERERVIVHLDKIRKLAGLKKFAKVASVNNFPRGTGIASSASGFAALSLAATKAADLNLSKKELSILARMGSGSACRSVPDGIVEWKAGENSNTSFAYSLYPSNYWEIHDLIVIVGERSKKVSSTEGHTLVNSSPFYKARLFGMDAKIKKIKVALKEKDFTALGEIVEGEAINMHCVMMSSKPPLFYWSPLTLEIILSVIDWRGQGLEAYFTLDAGPNVHVLCEKSNIANLISMLSNIKGVGKIIDNVSTTGVKLLRAKQI